MKKTIAKKWAKALRSGKYKQTQGRLRDEDGFCCLGVLCELSGLSYRGSDKSPPSDVLSWAGLGDPDGKISDYGRKNRTVFLTALNDGINGERHSFKRIASIIERRWYDL